MNLRELNESVASSISHLPSANPLTLSTSSLGQKDENAKIRAIIHQVCSDHLARTRIENEYFASGPLEPYLADSDVTEIIVNGPDKIWVERLGKLTRVEDQFLSELSYRNFIARLSRDSGIQANLDFPFADGKWRGCRVHLSIPPASGEQAVLSLRRHPDSPWTFEKLEASSWASSAALEILKKLVSEKKNFLVIGCTGSGKTSVLNACLATLGETERALLIEDTSELKIPNAASSKLLTRRDPQGHLKEIDQSELLKQALRMRPDRLVLGEIRGGEAKDLLMAFATGHSGCMGTLHAESARQALIRLEMLVQLGAPQWSLHAVRTLIWLSLQTIVVVGKNHEGQRKLEGIYKVASLEDVGFLIEKVI